MTKLSALLSMPWCLAFKAGYPLGDGFEVSGSNMRVPCGRY